MKKEPELLHAMRHSLAHIMAASIATLWPKAKFGVGPVVENGFYYDLDLGSVTLSEEDFARIEKQMRTLIDADQPFEQSELPIEDAIKWAKETNQPYKEELLNDLKRSGTTAASDIDSAELGVSGDGSSKVSTVSFYKNGDFTDLCRGPHVASTGKVGAFKLLRISGAYWRAKETNPQMQRIYGAAFENEDQLQVHLKMLAAAQEHDHRKIGAEMDLFTFSNLIGSGLPLWTPRGTIIRRELDRFVQELRSDYDYQEVSVPHITKKEAYEKSGHWQKFEHELFKIKTREGHEFAMKPMNCPHHAQIYARRPHSYKELPVRYRETTTVYRDEQTGELAGLSRVRAITQDDAHVFCRDSQIKEEVVKIWDIVDRFYSVFNFPLEVRFSRHDPKRMSDYLGSSAAWSTAETQLEEIIRHKAGREFSEAIGEAAFYGPKIDFMSKDALGRTWQVATIQLDFNQPEGFDLTCINEQGEKERIIMIHAAIMGSIDRFLSVLLEHFAGRLPVWLSPEQVRIVTVNQEKKTTDFASKIQERAKELDVRVGVDNANESVGKKIRDAEVAKVPYTIVIGEKELESDKVTPRVRKDIEVHSEHQAIGVENFLKTVANESKARVIKTSL